MAEKRPAGDFKEVINDYLERGQVYKPAGKFISELVLCQRYIGGGEKTKGLLEVVLRMVNLAKERLASATNKKIWKCWLKEAARALDTYQIVDRQWICQNVHDLPKPQVLKEQAYDPMAGKRDIRYYPSATASGSKDKEDVLDVELSKEEEDALLRSSPERKTPSPSLFPSPRRSPRLAKKASLAQARTQSSEASSLDIVVQAPSSQSRASDSERTSSLSRGPPTPAFFVPVFRASSSDTGSHRPQSPSKRSGQDNRRKLADPRASSSDSQSQNKKDKARTRPQSQVASSSGLDSSKTPERKVTLGRGMTIIEYTSGATATPGKRIAELPVISTSTQKKQKVEDILAQVKEAREEKDKERTQGKSRARYHSCWVPGCESQRYLKAHAYKEHVPGIFTEALPASDPEVLKGRKKALSQAARWLLSRPATLDELLHFVNIQRLLSATDNSSISEVQHKAMVEFCTFLQSPVPHEFTLVPANSPGVLIHWKAVLLMSASLEDEERQYWKDSFPQPEETTEETEGDLGPVEEVLPVAFDSHFYLDRSLKELGLPVHGSLKDVLTAVHVNQDERVKLVGSVAVFCDPQTYPSGKSLLDLPEDMSVAVGIHPRHAHGNQKFMEDSVRSLTAILMNPRVKALGEIGLDHTEPMKHWHLQVDLLHRVLPLLQDNHTLVIHCRGMRNDCGTEAYLLLLHVLRKYVRPQHPIHLHCFAGNHYVVQRWVEAFPRTYFGFTNMVQSFRQDQVEALKNIDERCLLLESDAPYFPSMGTRKSSPGQLMTVAKAVAQHKGIFATNLLEITVENARHLYLEQ